MGYPTPISEVDLDGNPTATFYDTFFYDDSIAAYWRFGNATALDDELDFSDGTLSGGPTLVTGLLPFDSDHALSFDGVNDYASVPSTASLLQPGDWTLLGRIKFSSLPGALKALVTKGAFAVEIRADGKLQFHVQNDVSGVTTRTTVVGTTVLEPNTEYTVICDHDATNGELRLYLDGILEASSAHTVGVEQWGMPVLFAARHGGTVPVVASVGSAISHSGVDPTATWVVPKATGLAVGDLMVVHLFNSCSNGLTDQTVTLPSSGWSTLIYDRTTTAQLSTLIAYKIADASDVAASSFTFVFAGAFAAQNVGWGRMLRITGADSTAPFANPGYLTHGSSVAGSSGAKYAGCDDALALFLIGMQRAVSWTSPDGTELYDTAGGGGAGTSAAGYSATVTDSSTAKSFTATSNGTGFQWQGVTLFLKGPDAQDFCAVELDEWVLLSRALDDDDALDAHEARLSGYSGWTDITDQSRSFKTKRGRQYELNKIETGAINPEVISDPDRDFDPANQASPHWPNVIPKRRRRLQAVVGGNTYPIFQGFADRWPPDYIAPGYQEIQVTASDGFFPLSWAPATGTLASALSGAQIHKLLDMAKWPRSDRAIDDGQFIMAEWELPAKQKVLDSIQEIADGELGLFFIDRAGVATFHDYAHRWTQSRSLNPQAVFSDDDTDLANGAIPYLRAQGLVPSFDDDNTVTEWNVSTADGSTATKRDVVAARRSFPLSKDRTTRLASIVDAEAQAFALLHETARAGLRYDSLSPEPESDADWQAVLSLEISDRVTVTHEGDTQDCFVEGISIVADPGRWVMSLQLSPVSPATYYDTIFGDAPVSFYYDMGGTL